MLNEPLSLPSGYCIEGLKVVGSERMLPRGLWAVMEKRRRDVLGWRRKRSANGLAGGQTSIEEWKGMVLAAGVHGDGKVSHEESKVQVGGTCGTTTPNLATRTRRPFLQAGQSRVISTEAVSFVGSSE